MQNANSDKRVNMEISRNEEIDDRGIGWIIFDKSKEHKDDVIRIDAATGQKRTRGRLLKDGIKVALNMVEQGITSNDIISVCTNSNSDCILPIIAAYMLGVKIAPMDPLLSIEEAACILKQIEPTVVFCCPTGTRLIKTAMKLSGVTTNLVVFGETNEHTPFSHYLKETGKEKDFKPVTNDNIRKTSVILFTSGTTGLPKGIGLSDFNLQSALKISKIPVMILNYRPIYGILATVAFISTCINTGSCVVSADFDSTCFFKIIQDYKINVIYIPPDQLHKVISNMDDNTYDISSLKIIYAIGTVLGEKQMLKFRKLFPGRIISQIYGLTETTGCGLEFNLARDAHLISSKPGSCGRVQKGTQCKVLDLETNEVLGPDQPGELWIKSNTIMVGYYKDKKSDELFDSEGFFRTGDIVYYDEDGCYFVVDRIKDMMKFESWKIIPAELEQILFQHREVQDAIVVARPHEIDGDHPTAIVVRKPNSNLREQDILDFVNTKVPDHKRLRGGVIFVNSIPMTPTGKYQRRELKYMLQNGSL